MAEFSVDINPANAKALLIDESFKRPVLVDFWADWCGPCKSLTPILEKLAAEYAGAFLLAKINVDSEQMIAAQFGVQSLPTCVLMKDGRPIDGFTGAQPEKEVRAILEAHLPKPWDEMHARGRSMLQAGDPAEAVGVLLQAYRDSGEAAGIGVTLAEAYLGTRRLEDAEAILSKVRLADRDADYERVLAELDLARSAAKAPEIEALEARHQANPEDQEVAFELAVQYAQHQYHSEALALLYDLLSRNLNARDGEVRKTFNDVLAVLGKGDPLAVSYQRKLYSLIY